MSLDDLHDYQVEAITALAKGTVNAKLQALVGEDAIKMTFGSPLPVQLLAQTTAFPCLCVYRHQDRDKELSQLDYEDTTTFRFDYFAPATPVAKIDVRRPLLRKVWETMLGVLRVGRDPSVANEAELLKAGGLFRYVLGTARVEYTFAPGTGQVYPAFRGQMDFDGCYPTPDSFYDDLDRCLLLDSFERLDVDWDLRPKLNQEFEARNEIDLPQ